MSGRFPSLLGPLAGALAGFAVGLFDGARVGLLVGVHGAALLWTALLAAGIDTLAGLAVGLGAELVARLSLWGRSVVAPRPARVAAWIVAGLAAAAAAVVVTLGTAERRNRFLAAGLVCVAGATAAVLAAILAPALARLVAGRRGRASTASPSLVPSPAAALSVPAAIALAAAAVFAVMWNLRPPLRGEPLVRACVGASLAMAALPWVMSWGAGRAFPRRWRTALLIAGGAFLIPAVGGVTLTWNDHLRFVPWVDLAVGLAMILVGAGLALLLRPRLPSPRARVALVAAFAGAAAVLGVETAEVEPARKATSARAGLIGPLLAAGRTIADLDRDGYAAVFGGGDCDDRDPTTHPGALDLPRDGIDADCDGQDAAGAALEPPPFAAVPDSVPRPLNFLLITIDTIRADHLGCYGYQRSTSPEIDRLASEGAVFENGWAHAPSTRYSMPAIATGRWPSAIVWDESIWWPRIGPGMRVLSEALHEAGLVTGGLFSYSYFDPRDRRGFERGMDVYDARRGALHVAVNGPMESRGSSSPQMADDAIAFIEGHRDRPFFLWVHFYDPHLAYERHPELPSTNFGSSRVDLYDGEIRFTDHHVGRVLARLRELGLYDRTAVFVTGDHGEGFGEHGVTEHGFHLYAPQTKVPFIVRVPGLGARRSTVPAGHVDLAPTMVNLARLPQDQGFLGRSLVGVLSGAEATERPIFQEVTSERGKRRALVTSKHHLIWNWIPENTTECYDLAADPAEQRDLWNAPVAVPECSRLKTELQGMVGALALPPGWSEKLARGVIPRGAPMPVPRVQVAARLGDAVRVLGSDLTPAEARPGDTVEVATYFAVDRPVGAHWRLFFHLEHAGIVHNLDHIPVEGVLPFDQWRPGQRIVDRHRFTLPRAAARGTYTLYIGAFRGASRLPVSPRSAADSGNRLRLGALVVR